MLWLEAETADGVVGLGETFYAAEAVEAYIHANLAPIVLGMSAVDIEAVHYRTRPYVGFVAASTELRARSALDIALWDVLGKLTGQPISVLLGGRIRSQIPVYNTCAGNQYVRGTKLGTTENFGIALREQTRTMKTWIDFSMTRSAWLEVFSTWALTR